MSDDAFAPWQIGAMASGLPEGFLTAERRITLGFVFQRFNMIRGSNGWGSRARPIVASNTSPAARPSAWPLPVP